MEAPDVEMPQGRDGEPMTKRSRWWIAAPIVLCAHLGAVRAGDTWHAVNDVPSPSSAAGGVPATTLERPKPLNAPTNPPPSAKSSSRGLSPVSFDQPFGPLPPPPPDPPAPPAPPDPPTTHTVLQPDSAVPP